jgi:hypothetical protein
MQFYHLHFPTEGSEVENRTYLKRKISETALKLKLIPFNSNEGAVFETIDCLV